MLDFFIEKKLNGEKKIKWNYVLLLTLVLTIIATVLQYVL
jgi:hypothetical protein